MHTQDQDQSSECIYQEPAPEMIAVVDASAQPELLIAPGGRLAAVLQPCAVPAIADLSTEEWRLAGMRLDPRRHAPKYLSLYDQIYFKSIDGDREWPMTGLPEGAYLTDPYWSPDASHVAFTLREDDGFSPWVADSHSGAARPLAAVSLNLVFSHALTWLPDSSGVIALLRPDPLPKKPQRCAVPSGPRIRESGPQATPAWTYQDLLIDAYDCDRFEHIARSRVARINCDDGTVCVLGEEGLYARAEPSPDGRYLLLETVHRPFSYLVQWHRFPRRIAIWDERGNELRQLADLPLAEAVSTQRDACPMGPRNVSWRADAPASLVWVEALDKGDPTTACEHRDRLLLWPAPFVEGDAATVLELGFRGQELRWITDGTVLVTERWWATRRERVWALDVDSGSAPVLLSDRSSEDAYSDRGSPLLKSSSAGTQLVQTDADGRHFYMLGLGASAEGNRPFVDRVPVDALKNTSDKGASERLWRSSPPFYEVPVALLGADHDQLLITRESPSKPPYFVILDLKNATEREWLATTHPYPDLSGCQKELIHYQRADGVQLSANLYVPAAYDVSQGPIPLLLWAYPREYKDAAAAGQVKESPYRFIQMSPTSPLPLLTQGVAILDGPAMPIIGEGDREPNDSYVEQLVAGATAAVDEVVRRGVADRKHIAVGGHSYGGFMTANLLIHSRLFCCGIARSGAYNRTLTPFGFQSEERILWEALEVYTAMAPFNHAHGIEAPLLLIHGEVDENSGTYSLQSERLFAALQGLGKEARLVMLPHERHRYTARESVLHVLWEEQRWLAQHCGLNQ